MQIKQGVILNGLQIEMRKVLIRASEIWKEHGQELVVTSGLEGTHSAASYHYYGFAVDLRTRYFNKTTARTAADQLQYRLGNDYVVILELTHIHVHYPKEIKNV